jgi:hypothetical protein
LQLLDHAPVDSAVDKHLVDLQRPIGQNLEHGPATENREVSIPRRLVRVPGHRQIVPWQGAAKRAVTGRSVRTRAKQAGAGGAPMLSWAG